MPHTDKQTIISWAASVRESRRATTAPLEERRTAALPFVATLERAGLAADPMPTLVATWDDAGVAIVRSADQVGLVSIRSGHVVRVINLRGGDPQLSPDQRYLVLLQQPDIVTCYDSTLEQRWAVPLDPDWAEFEVDTRHVLVVCGTGDEPPWEIWKVIDLESGTVVEIL